MERESPNRDRRRKRENSFTREERVKEVCAFVVFSQRATWGHTAHKGVVMGERGVLFLSCSFSNIFTCVLSTKLARSITLGDQHCS